MAINVTLPSLSFPKRGEVVRDDFVAAQQTAQDILSGTWTTNANLMITQLNTTEANINSLEQSCNNLFTLTTSYNAQAKQARDEALSYSNASQTSYNNTVALLDGIDITGTGGYTADTVDDLLSRQRNLQLVGLNLI